MTTEGPPAAATTSHLMASESLFRMGVVSQWITYLSFLLLLLPLYALLKPVNKTVASLMVLLVIVSVPIGMLSTLNGLSALSLVSGADYLSAFTPDQIQAQVMHFLDRHDGGYLTGQITLFLFLPVAVDHGCMGRGGDAAYAGGRLNPGPNRPSRIRKRGNIGAD